MMGQNFYSALTSSALTALASIVSTTTPAVALNSSSVVQSFVTLSEGSSNSHHNNNRNIKNNIISNNFTTSIKAKSSKYNNKYNDNFNHQMNTTLMGSSATIFNRIDDLMIDRLPLQLINNNNTPATASSTNTTKMNFDIEIDIQLLTNEYELTTITTFNYNETAWINPSEADIILGEDQAVESFVWLLVVGIFLSVLIFLSIAGNILVCIAIYTERSLRRIGNLFLASLAIADLFVASLVMTFAGVNDLLGYWIFGAQFCDTWVAFDVMCSTASILNLCAISLDRYIHIKDPLRYGRWVTRRVVVITIATIWLLAAFVSFVPISLGLHRPDDQPLIVDDNGKKISNLCAGFNTDVCGSFELYQFLLSVRGHDWHLLSVSSILYCYAQKHVKSIKAVTRPGEVAEKQRYKSIRRQKPQQKKFKVRNPHSSPYHVSDHKAAITVGVIMGVFLICWVPFFCVNIVAAFCKTCIGGQTFKILSWLGYSNSAFNPIIYSIFNKEFRDAFKRILTTRNIWCCAQDVVNIHPRNSDRFVTDYAANKHMVTMNSGRSSAELEQVSAI
uniref:G-protein coupled receptors family 1 profile domain-containing protein n=1 Tax=Glossina morsitans morsitans TaxID=37546 RepID=A0A1B0FEI1_GLOMM